MFLNNKLIISIIILMIREYSCGEIPLQIQVLQNPKLFGGDIVGYVHRQDTSYRNALKSDLQLWPNGIIPFVIDSSLASIRTLILRAMNNYMEHTCIRFVPRTTQYDYINITAMNGCYSNVGRAGGSQIVSLGTGCHYVGTIVHELGHSVGFFHEHQRSDRDDYIAIVNENVLESSVDQFEKMQPEDNRLFVDYDYNSVMHYGASAFSKQPDRLITMRPLKRGAILTEVFDKYGLSQPDIESVNKLYSC